MKKNIGEPLNLTLNKLVSDGSIDEKWDSEKQDFSYSLTEEGQKKSEKLISKDYTMRAMLFTLIWNNKTKAVPKEKWNTLLFEIAEDFKKRFGTNLLRDIEYWQEKGIISHFMTFNKNSLDYEIVLEHFDKKKEFD